MRKYLTWSLWVVILGVFGVIGINRLINALIHSKAERVVPDLIGSSVIDALNTTSPLNIYIKKIGDEFNPEIPAGLIMSQTPPPGSIVKEDRVIKIVLSAGGEVVYVPELRGETVRSAQVILRHSGLDLGEQSVRYSTTVVKGRLLAQDPASNTAYQKNGLVNIVVSMGPPPPGTVLMPDFIGKDIALAEEWADNNEIFIKNISKVGSFEFKENQVLTQQPAAGEIVSRTTEVEFCISIGGGF